jgi:hypothetical protein
VFPNQIREGSFCFVGEEKRRIKHLAEKLKQQNFNLYAQFNIEMIGVPMKEII